MKYSKRAAILTVMLGIGVAMSFILKKPESDVIKLDSKRELFIDHFLIERLNGTRLMLHHPHDEGITMRFDKPWEGAFCGYVTVIRDGDIFRAYYRGLPESGKDGSSAEVTCYAESADGIRWEKPDLGIFEINGTRNNNVILADAAPVTHNFSPFLDVNPDAGP